MALAQAIKKGKELREKIEEEIGTTLVFAQLELSELKAGIRSPLDCPGIENVAKYIEDCRQGSNNGQK